MKLETLRKRLNSKNANQLAEYCRHNMKWKKIHLIYLLTDSGCVVPQNYRWDKLCNVYKEEIIDIIIETYEGA